jgi:hypothetical protein
MADQFWSSTLHGKKGEMAGGFHAFWWLFFSSRVRAKRARLEERT